MKLIIDIPDNYVEDFKIEQKFLGDELTDNANRYAMARYSIVNGIPLEDIKAEIEEQKSLWDSTPKNGHYRAFSTCIDILDEYISELKGGNK